MSYPVIRGQANLPAQQPYREQYSPSKGNVITKTWIGTYQDGAASDLTLLIPSLVVAGYEYTLQQTGQGGLWRLEATIGNDLPEYTWELGGDEEQKDLLNSTLPDVQNLSLANQQVLRAAADFYSDLKGATPQPTGSLRPGEAASFNLIWQNMMAGMRYVPVSLPIVRRTYIASRQFQVTDSVLNINIPHSKATLIGSEGVPSQYWSCLPETGGSFIGQLPVNYGYIKKAPKIELITNNRIRISQEWKYNAWSTLIGPLI